MLSPPRGTDKGTIQKAERIWEGKRGKKNMQEEHRGEPGTKRRLIKGTQKILIYEKKKGRKIPRPRWGG